MMMMMMMISMDSRNYSVYTAIVDSIPSAGIVRLHHWNPSHFAMAVTVTCHWSSELNASDIRSVYFWYREINEINITIMQYYGILHESGYCDNWFLTTVVVKMRITQPVEQEW